MHYMHLIMNVKFDVTTTYAEVFVNCWVTKELRASSFYVFIISIILKGYLMCHI
jgi:hypothetical protein